MKDLNKKFKGHLANKMSVLLFVLILSLIFQIGCSTLEVESKWRDREIKVDGKSDDWLGALYYFENKKVSVGFLNDESYIYICMIAEDRLLRAQVMRQGFTIWFDPDGGKEKIFGIKYPIGIQGRGSQEIPMRMREEEQEREKFRETFEGSMAELEILGPGKDEQKRMPVEDAKGINIVLKPSSGILVYEIKVPLFASEQHPYAAGARAGSSIGLGLEIPRMDMSAMRERMGGGRPGGIGMPGGGRGGMGGGGGMGMRSGRRPQMPKGLKVWITVKLASESSTVQE